jgi:hypothetical protein
LRDVVAFLEIETVGFFVVIVGALVAALVVA